MKRCILFLLILIAGFNARSQTFTIANNSKSAVFYQILASDKGNCKDKYTSLTLQISPESKIIYKSTSEIQWLGKKPGKTFEYCGLNGIYIDASGDCNANATNTIGETRCKFSRKAIINTAKCGGTGGDLDLSWSSKNGSITVTIK